MTVERYRVVRPECAEKVRSWIAERGGALVWASVDLSEPGKEILTPLKSADGSPCGKPHWKMGNNPVRRLAALSEVEVAVPLEVKRFHVGVRMGAQGLSLKVTDGGTRRIRRECEKAGEDSWHEFDYGSYENAVIYKPGKVIPLEELPVT